MQEAIFEAYQRGPALFSPGQFLDQIKEFDSHQLSNLVRDLSFLRLNYGDPSEMDRLRAVNESRYHYRTSVLVKYAIFLWGAYGYGENVEVLPADKKAQDAWNEFWRADRNVAVLGDRRLQEHSDVLLKDGEIFLVFYVSHADGKCTVRTLDTTEITEFVTAPSDSGTTVFYRRQWQDPVLGPMDVYYPDALTFIAGASGGLAWEEVDFTSAKFDWTGKNAEGKKISSRDLLPEGAKRADEMMSGTFVCVLPVVFNRLSGGRGWPLMVGGFPWVKEHEQFRVNRANVAEAASMFFRDLSVQGGSRAVKDAKAFFESTFATGSDWAETNPPPASGSTFVHNGATEMRNVSQLTGAGDAKEDGGSLAWYAMLSAGLFPHYAGMGDAYRLATATSMEQPILRQFTRYQRFWSSVWRDVLRIVLTMRERYGGESFDSYEAEVNLDKIIQSDSTALIGSVSQAYSSMLVPLLAAGVIPDEVSGRIIVKTWQLVLQEMGVQDVDEVINQDEWEKLAKALAEEKKKQQELMAQQMNQPGAGSSGEPGQEGQPPEEEQQLPPGAQPTQAAEEWNEEDHPRDENGRFTFGGDAGLARVGLSISEEEVSTLTRMATEGGFSYQVLNHSMPEKGFMVSPYKDREKKMGPNSLTRRRVISYLINNADVLRREDHYLGGWLNQEDGQFYLDVSQRFDSREEALRVARANDQEGIFDLEKLETINARESELGGWTARRQVLASVSGLRQSVRRPAVAAGGGGGRGGRHDRGGVEGSGGGILEPQQHSSLTLAELQSLLEASVRILARGSRNGDEE